MGHGNNHKYPLRTGDCKVRRQMGHGNNPKIPVKESTKYGWGMQRYLFSKVPTKVGPKDVSYLLLRLRNEGENLT